MPRSTTKDKRPYIVVADEFPRHPKTLDLTDSGFRAVIELWCYCNEYRTDGHVPRGHLKRSYGKVLNELIDLGFVEETPDGYYMHDYLEHQKSSEEIAGHKEKKRASASIGGRKSNHTRNHAGKGLIFDNCEFCTGFTPPPQSLEPPF